jgi:DNA-binding NtrC family response regulator
MTPDNEPILVVDDDEGCARTVALTLMRAGLPVETLSDPLRALWRITHQPYALVITDLNMPGLLGTRLLAELRQVSPRTPGLLLTGFPDARARADARALGVRILCKPVSNEELVETVRSLVTPPQAAAQ